MMDTKSLLDQLDQYVDLNQEICDLVTMLSLTANGMYLVSRVVHLCQLNHTARADYRALLLATGGKDEALAADLLDEVCLELNDPGYHW